MLRNVQVIRRYRNKFHSSNCYIDFNIKDIKEYNLKNIFQTIANEENANLQVMVSSEEVDKIKILQENGFKKVRSCYEVEVKRADLLVDTSKNYEVIETELGTEEYKRCTELLFKNYKETHKNINPFTSTFKEFIVYLPERVFFREENGQIIHCAFVEENEIAYVSSINKETYNNFITSVVKVMFEEQETVSFKVDNVDWVAMELKNLFVIDDSETYDTWI